uniref:NADH-ubiquinone oxidoreductase chain 5 n=1 Tax=Margarinotus merdarius TaxID=878136 RepID=A0A0S2M7L8_MARMD|nr:NADH dehydrogenase subunit 5 [Margarinotus merdarius]ALO70679.1 NADH deshydrogenase subunit 5 [Margarinotus merdarius]
MCSLTSFLTGIVLLSNDLSFMLEFELITVNSAGIFMTVLLDWMSLVFMSFVLYISSMVIYYSEEYMHGDLNLNRFIMLICLFVASMMFLIISPNLISILIGWDGLGLVSYCLVIYYQNVKSFNAGMITALSNRIGDVALLMSIAWMLNYGSWNYLFYLDSSENSLKIISALVILAAMTKSAQIPFSSWLPAAMAAPTPVSSLVHSSTLVTAGVYLLIRFSPSFTPSMSFFLLFISSLTMLMSGIAANFEFDLKKIIALSTLSQLGLMMGILSVGLSDLAFFHLLTHALFKALLFMCAGVVIHNLADCQDIRYMGGIGGVMPLTSTLLNVSNLALCGFPFLAGFYSKDLILESFSMGISNFFIYLIFYVATGLTVSYSIRLVYYTMVGDPNLLAVHSLSESGTKMIKGMFGLFFLVIIGGSVFSWVLLPTPSFINLPFTLKVMTIVVILSGAHLGYECAKFRIGYTPLSFDSLSMSQFLASMWNLPFLSTFSVNYYPVYVGGLTYKCIDQGWSEYLGPQGLFFSLTYLSRLSQWFMNNNLKVFLMLMAAWIITVILA